MKVAGASGAAVSAPDVTGYLCKRGLTYALDECANPVRTLTTTVRISHGEQALAPVKSARPLPKSMLPGCMAVLNTCTAEAPLQVGDVIVENILGTGVDIISTANISRGDNVWKEGIS